MHVLFADKLDSDLLLGFDICGCQLENHGYTSQHCWCTGWFAASAGGVHLMQVQTLLPMTLCNLHVTPGHVGLALG